MKHTSLSSKLLLSCTRAKIWDGERKSNKTVTLGLSPDNSTAVEGVFVFMSPWQMSCPQQSSSHTTNTLWRCFCCSCSSTGSRGISWSQLGPGTLKPLWTSPGSRCEGCRTCLHQTANPKPQTPNKHQTPNTKKPPNFKRQSPNFKHSDQHKIQTRGGHNPETLASVHKSFLAKRHAKNFIQPHNGKH